MERLASFALAALAGVVVLIAVATHRDYGITWDEGAQARYGDLAVDYFRSGFADRRVDEFLSLRIYGPLFESALSVAAPESGVRRFEIRHLLTALFGLLVLPALLVAARPIGEAWLAPAAAVALLTMPRFTGHLFTNSKDVPFAAAFALSAAALVRLQTRPDRPWGKMVAIGGALGLAASLRPGGLPLLLGMLVLALVASGAAERRSGAAPFPVLDVVVKGAVAVVIAWGLLVAFWPWAHEDPIGHPIAAMRRAAALKKVYPVLFEGTVTPSTELPARYLPQFLFLTTPPFTLSLAAVGLIAAGASQVRAPLRPSSRALLLWSAWLLVPLATFGILRPNVYDGLRHFLFVLPALALFAAYGACRVVRAVPEGAPRLLAAAVVGAALLAPAGDIVRLHPYAASYFNAFAGGLRGAEGRYETDYWASSYREAIDWIRARESPAERRIRVLLAANRLSFLGYRAYGDERLELVPLDAAHRGPRLPPGFDYYVGTYRYGLADLFPAAPVVHRVERDGATFAVVRAAPAASPREAERP